MFGILPLYLAGLCFLHTFAMLTMITFVFTIWILFIFGSHFMTSFRPVYSDFSVQFIFTNIFVLGTKYIMFCIVIVLFVVLGSTLPCSIFASLWCVFFSPSSPKFDCFLFLFSLNGK